MAKQNEGLSMEFIQNKQHADQERWLVERGEELPLGCIDPLEILILIEIELELNLDT
jgi:hypothetical protein